MADDESRSVAVRLLGVPLRLRARALEHDQDLLRELALMRVSAETVGTTSAPERLLDLADELRGTYGSATAEVGAAMEAALEEGHEVMDATVTVPARFRPFLRRVAAALDEVEQFAREGRYLLTLGAPPDVARYRAWVLAEFDRQIAGGEPVRWSDTGTGERAEPAGDDVVAAPHAAGEVA